MKNRTSWCQNSALQSVEWVLDTESRDRVHQTWLSEISSIRVTEATCQNQNRQRPRDDETDDLVGSWRGHATDGECAGKQTPDVTKSDAIVGVAQIVHGHDNRKVNTSAGRNSQARNLPTTLARR